MSPDEVADVHAVYIRALDAYGRDAQQKMAMEECAELIGALCHWMRKRTTDGEVADEVADVLVVAGQMALLFGADDVERRFRRKVVRLARRLALDEVADRLEAGGAPSSGEVQVDVRARDLERLAARVAVLEAAARSTLDELTRTGCEHLGGSLVAVLPAPPPSKAIPALVATLDRMAAEGRSLATGEPLEVDPETKEVEEPDEEAAPLVVDSVAVGDRIEAIARASGLLPPARVATPPKRECPGGECSCHGYSMPGDPGVRWPE